MKARKSPRRCVICGASYSIKGSAKTCGADDCRAEVVKRRHERFRVANRAKCNAWGARYYRADPKRHGDIVRRYRAKKNAAPPPQ